MMIKIQQARFNVKFEPSFFMLVIIPYNLSSVKPYKVLRFAIYDQRIANERMM